MTPSSWRGVKLGFALFLAALLQSVYSDSLTFGGAHPDFLLATAIVGAMFCTPNGGATLGFFAGLLHACLAAPPHGGFGSLIVTRTLAGFGVGWLEDRIFRDNALIALALVALGTTLAEGLFFIFAPLRNVAHWARGMGLTVLYNTLLAIPLYLLIRRLLGPHRDDKPKI